MENKEKAEKIIEIITTKAKLQVDLQVQILCHTVNIHLRTISPLTNKITITDCPKVHLTGFSKEIAKAPNT